MKYLDNKITDPYYNLALEEWIFKNKYDDDYFMLWQNDRSIIIGRNQNTIEEINQAFVEDESIKVVRRMPGGGAVYHDLGNVNFSFFTNADDDFEINFKKIAKLVTKSLKNMGIDAYLSGRNDILINDKKISGLSQRSNDKRTLTNGAILFDVNLDMLTNALRVKEDKFRSKGVKSVRSRVNNIKNELDYDMEINEFIKNLKSQIISTYPSYEEISLSKEENQQIINLRNSKYITYEWNYGQSLPSNLCNYKYFPNKGLLEVRAILNNGLIEDIKLYGDFFSSLDIRDFEKLLIGKKYKPDEIKSVVNTIDLRAYLGHITIDDLIDVMFA